jgi:hypothetical protein
MVLAGVLVALSLAGCEGGAGSEANPDAAQDESTAQEERALAQAPLTGPWTVVVDKVIGSRVPGAVAPSQDWTFDGECDEIGCSTTLRGELVYEGGESFPVSADLLGIGRRYSGNAEGDFGCGRGSERLVFQNLKVISGEEIDGQWRATEFVGKLYCSNELNFGFRLRIKGTLET